MVNIIGSIGSLIFFIWGNKKIVDEISPNGIKDNNKQLYLDYNLRLFQIINQGLLIYNLIKNYIIFKELKDKDPKLVTNAENIAKSFIDLQILKSIEMLKYVSKNKSRKSRK